MHVPNIPCSASPSDGHSPIFTDMNDTQNIALIMTTAVILENC